MDGINNISDAGLYSDFNNLAKLRAEASTQSHEATKEVAKQFESLFLQMMLKSMRDTIPVSESTESDQTRFYQEMFDKQIALDLSKNEKGFGLGMAALLEKEIAGNQPLDTNEASTTKNLELINSQINRSSSSIRTNINSEQE